MTAQDYWAKRSWSPMLLERRPYRDAMANAVLDQFASPPDIIVEFGCGAGENLAAIDDALSGNGQDGMHDTLLVGVDVNRVALDMGRERYPSLSLVEGDIGALEDIGEVDVVFTVSALCHLDDPGPVIEAMLAMAPVLVLLEPDVRQDEGLIEADPNGHPATPHSYQWDYARRLRALGARVTVRNMPIGLERLQPWYKLFVARR